MPLAAQGTPREPFLVDNDYYLSGFSYTRLYEPDWTELFFSAQTGNYKAEFGLFASLYSDYASARLRGGFSRPRNQNARALLLISEVAGVRRSGPLPAGT